MKNLVPNYQVLFIVCFCLLVTPSGAETFDFNDSVSKAVLNEINTRRISHGRNALRINNILCEVAQSHAEDMKKNDFFAHHSPQNGNLQDRIKTTSYSYRTIGENLSTGHLSPLSLVNAWMKSAKHRVIILEEAYREIGIGYVGLSKVSDKRIKGPYWVAVFGASSH